LIAPVNQEISYFNRACLVSENQQLTSVPAAWIDFLRP
jgi:hypothetical protein